MTSRNTSPDVLYAKLLPISSLSTLRMRNSQTAQLTGNLSAGLVTRSSCMPVTEKLAAAKTFNHQALASRPSDLFHSSSATAAVPATTSPPPSPSGCPLSKNPVCSPDQHLRPSRLAISDNVCLDAKSASGPPELVPASSPSQTSQNMKKSITTPDQLTLAETTVTMRFPSKRDNSSINPIMPFNFHRLYNIS